MRKDGGPAFPRIDGIESGDYGRQSVFVTGGMSLRDYFAAAALTGLLASAHGTITARVIACEALAIADAMVEAREGGRDD